jgi:ubiquinone/menaquinone biosynthesis C-methylase UbiE
MKNSPVKSWDHYWGGHGIRSKRFFYNLVASSYRRLLIRPHLNYFMKKYFEPNSNVLHAGCGGGEVDMDLQKYLNITALDFSPNALRKYRVRHKGKCKIVQGNIKSLRFKPSTFDGVYNLGVLEHFNKKDIGKILKGFRKILKTKGTLVIFWPPEFGVSVTFFKILVFICRELLNIKNVEFHPIEISRLKSKNEAKKIFKESGFSVVECSYGLRDLFTYVVIVAKKTV